MNKNTKLIKRMLMIIAAIILFTLLIITGVLLIYSPGKPAPFLNNMGNMQTGSISEKVFLTIGGIRQGMFIKSKNINNPVLLYVHGGPAFPNYFLVDKYKPGLEDYFTICYWEQRGGGLSYSSEVTLQSMNFNQLTIDAIEVTNYLRKRFNQEKIYIIAHSGGTPIALLAVQKAPELFFAYIAMAQITNQKASERIAYQYMMNQYQEAGNQKSVKELQKYSVLESDSNIVSFYKSVTRDQFMHELGIGTMHKMNSVFRDIFIPVWTCKAYTLGEKINIWKSKFTFLPETNLINELLDTDFSSKVTKLDIPVYFLSGKYDLTVNIDLSKAYFEKLEAPLKGFYIFTNSAHSPIFEEPLRVEQIIKNDILNGTNNLADMK
jgi:pimeloyl-ACP methyl ester carboxylesterase